MDRQIDLNDLDEFYTTILMTIAGNAEDNGTSAEKVVIYFGDLYARTLKHDGVEEAQRLLNWVSQIMDDARSNVLNK